MHKPVLTNLTLDPAEGERRGDVLIAVRFPAAAFVDSTPEDAAKVCADRVRGMATNWFMENGRRPDESAERFLARLRHGAVVDSCLTIESDRFASVQEVS